MQITLIRNGKHDKTGHLIHDGIEEGIGAGLLLGNASVGQNFKVPQVDWVLLQDDGNIAPAYHNKYCEVIPGMGNSRAG